MKQDLAWKNLRAKPLRTAALILLTALLSLTFCGGTLLVSSLKSGLHSLENRLGADIMVVPYEATTKADLENIVLQGNPGYFYMTDSIYEKIAQREGIGEISTQFFLASTSSSCCSVSVQIIGFDPETDFTVQPWIRRSFKGALQPMDIVVGSDLNAFVGDTLTFYGVECRVAAKLDRTGTYYDTSVFTTGETVKALIRSSLDLHMNDFAEIDPDKVVSCVLINTAEGSTTEDLLNDINIHVKKVKAIRTSDMISGISDSLSGVSDVIGGMIAAVWILGTVILLLAFSMSVNARKKEFAVLRVIGVSQKRLAGIILREGLIAGGIGSLLGAGLALLCLAAFHQLIENQLGLPLLLPAAGRIAWLAVWAVCVSVLAGAAAAAVSAYRISRADPALILRGDN